MKIADIARLANVSKSAVSFALNGKPGISDATREKILNIARAHGYMPRSMVKVDEIYPSNSKVLRFIACTHAGIITEEYENLPFFMELIGYINKKIRSKGYSLMISSINIDDWQEEIDALELEQHSDGIILLGTNVSTDQITYIADRQPNIVVIDTCFETVNVDFVVMNNVMGAYEAGIYLLQKGHTHIGYVQSNTRMYNFDMRRQGFEQALKEAKIRLNEKNVFSLSPTDITPQAIFKQQIQKLNTNDLPTALFCECDYMAISVIKSLTELGLQVPDDISVIGFDDIFEAQIISPELTTVQVKKNKMASLAVEKLVNKIEKTDEDSVKILVDTKIVERNSCKGMDHSRMSTTP